MKTRFSVICLVLIVLILCVAVCGCTNKTKETTVTDVNAKYIRTRLHVHNENETALICSTEELQMYLMHNEYDTSKPPYCDTSYKTDFSALDKYDAKYFKKNALILFIEGGNSATVRTTESYTLKDGIITIEVKTIREGMLCDIAENYFVLELNKKHAKNLTTIKINRDGKARIDFSLPTE